MFSKKETTLVFRFDAEELWIQPWGHNASRIRATKSSCMPSEDWALCESAAAHESSIEISENAATLSNGKIQARITKLGKLCIYKDDFQTLVLEEYTRNRRNRGDVLDANCSALDIEAREFKPLMAVTNIT
jgi:alpha-D-xyloside xylohydrolase